MAIRRATQKAQVVEKLASIAPPGEVFVACVHAETGPSPWLNTIFDRLPFVGLIVALSRKYYFFTLTNTSVVVNSASRFTNRPGDVVAVFPRAQFPASRYKRATIWSRFYLHFPNAAKPTRLNVHAFWRADLDQLATAFPAEQAPAGAQEQAPAAPLAAGPLPGDQAAQAPGTQVTPGAQVPPGAVPPARVPDEAQSPVSPQAPDA